jgi:CysZ protein
MGPGVILQSFFAALAQIGDPRFRRVVLLGILLAAALLVAVYALFYLAIATLTPDLVELPVIGPVEGLHTLFGWVSLGAMLALSFFLMVPAAAGFGGLFLDDVADAVEDRHYPWLPPARPQGWAEGLRAAVNMIGVIVAMNIGLLLLLPVTGPFWVPIYYGVNGYLLSREYFTMVALRRLPPEEVRAMRRRNFGRIWLAGILMALPLSLPLVNLIVPVLGTATFTQLFHRLARAGS